MPGGQLADPEGTAHSGRILTADMQTGLARFPLERVRGKTGNTGANTFCSPENKEGMQRGAGLDGVLRLSIARAGTEDKASFATLLVER